MNCTTKHQTFSKQTVGSQLTLRCFTWNSPLHHRSMRRPPIESQAHPRRGVTQPVFKLAETTSMGIYPMSSNLATEHPPFSSLSFFPARDYPACHVENYWRVYKSYVIISENLKTVQSWFLTPW